MKFSLQHITAFRFLTALAQPRSHRHHLEALPYSKTTAVELCSHSTTGRAGRNNSVHCIPAASARQPVATRCRVVFWRVAQVSHAHFPTSRFIRSPWWHEVHLSSSRPRHGSIMVTGLATAIRTLPSCRSLANQQQPCPTLRQREAVASL